MSTRARAARGGGQTVEFFGGLGQSRLLVLYLAAAVGASLYLVAVGYGTQFFVSLVANLALLALYLVIINVATRRAPARPQAVKHPRAETVLLVAYTAFLVARTTDQVPGGDLTGIVPGYRQVDGLLVEAVQTLALLLWPGGAGVHLAAVVSDLFWVLLVPLGVFLALGYRPSTLGLSFERWWVALPLLAIAALPAYVNGALLPAGGVAAIAGELLGALLVAGVAQEFFFRGLLLARVEAWRGHSLDALAIAALVYAAAHVPAYLAADGFDLTLITAKVFMGASAPTGLAWGYLFLRTRSVAPGALWHASPWPTFPFAP